MGAGIKSLVGEVFKTWPIRPWPLTAIMTLVVFMVNLAGFSSPVVENWNWVRGGEFLATLPSVFLSFAFCLVFLWAGLKLSERYKKQATLIYWAWGVGLGFLITLARVVTINDKTPEVWNYLNSSIRITVSTLVLYLIVHVSLGITGQRLAEQVRVAELARQSLEIQRGKLISAQEDVRRQVADFLHDRLQSDLVLLGMQLQGFIANLNEHDRSVAQAYIDEIERIRQFEVRGVSQQLAPEFAGPYFAPAINNLVARYSKAIKIDLDITEHGKLPELLRLACFRIIEQALLNAAKHAGATEVTVAVTELDSELIIRVTNNGDKLAPQPVAGAGFATIDEWVGQYSGTWNLSSQGDKTELLVSLQF